MAELHPFTFKVEPHTIHRNRYRWTILENGSPRHFSGADYPTSETAAAEADREMQRLIATWRIGK